MSSSNTQVHRLRIEAAEPGLSVLVVDAEGNVVGRCADDQSGIELDLSRGLYTLRSSRSGTFTETVIRLDGEQTVKAAPPPVFSAATVPGAATTHEYYTYPAWEASWNPTAPDQAWNGWIDSSLLLFARAPKRETYTGEDQFATLSLRAPDGRTLSAFGTDVKRDATGWSAYSARLSHGMLILEDRGERPRQLPVPLLHGWQTQLFVMHRGSLLWEDMRLSMVAEHELASRQHRSPYDDHAPDVRASLDMDAGLLALQNDAPSVGWQLINSFLNCNIQNPILGLLGAYLVLLYHRREPKNWALKPDPVQIRTVLDKLHALMPGSADVSALRLLAKDWVELPKLDPIEHVPLFRCGAEVLLRAAASEPALLPKGSLLDVVSGSLYGDTVWTTWKPLQLPLGMQIAAKRPSGMEEPDWVELAIIDAIAAAEPWDENFTKERLVRRMGVSPYAVRDAMNRVVKRVATEQSLPGVEAGDMRLLSDKIARMAAVPTGSGVDESLLTRITGAAAAQSGPERPSINQVYSGLTKALSDVSGKEADKVAADSAVSEIISPDDPLGRALLRRRLARQFAEYNIVLSNKELDAAGSVRDLANLIVGKLSVGTDAATDKREFEDSHTAIRLPPGRRAEGFVDSVDQTPSAEERSEVDWSESTGDADFQMAYGLYNEAAEIVRQELETEPSRRDLKMKLLDIFFVAGDKIRFVESAREFANSLVEGDAADWDRVLMMGRQLAPDDPLFKGGAPNSDDDVDVGVDFDFLGNRMGLDPPLPKTGLDRLAVMATIGRVAQAIIDLCNEPDALSSPQDIRIKITRRELAHLVGLPISMIVKALEVLEQQRLLAAHGKTIVVFVSRPKLSPPTMSEVGAKLDLARAYLDMGDPESARMVLEAVLAEGDSEQREEARILMSEIS